LLLVNLMNSVTLYDLNPQQKYTEYLLTNYSEKKQFYHLDAEERNYLQILQNRNELQKNPTWIGLIVQNSMKYISKITELPYYETISKFFGSAPSDTEVGKDPEVAVNFLSQAPVIGIELITDPKNQTIVDVNGICM
jgi:hypothetical protein